MTEAVSEHTPEYMTRSLAPDCWTARATALQIAARRQDTDYQLRALGGVWTRREQRLPARRFNNACKGRRCRPGGRSRLRLSYAPLKVDETLQQLADERFRRLVRQVALRVETLRGVADHDLRLVDGEDVQEDEYLS